MLNTQLVGRRGEDLAAEYYRQLGAQVIGQNVRVGRDEIDLVVRDSLGETVFVEVKMRTERGICFDGAQAVGPRKLRHLRRAIGGWLSEHSVGDVRIDVLVIEVGACEPKFTWYPGVENAAR